MGDTDDDQYRDQSDLAFHNPAWIQANGSWIHSNNVLFYFMASPFFDSTSENQQLLSQYGGTALEMEFMGNKARMESNLRKRRGLSYVVAHDPLETKTMVDGQPSNVWVIRKQIRERPDSENVTVLAYYFIVNEVIYQAPSIENVLAYRMLNTATALNQIFSTASAYPIFSASHGNTYLKPVQKATSHTQAAAASHHSKEVTPMPGMQSSATDKAPVPAGQDVSSVDKDSRIGYEALQMTLRYGREYADDVPLVGEPGNFRFSKPKDTTTSGNTGLQSAIQKQGTRTETPSHSRAPSAVPAPKLATPTQPSHPGEKSSPIQDYPNKTKRRKSRAGDINS